MPNAAHHRLIAVTPPRWGPAELDACRAAAEGGATAIQLRLKGIPAAEVLRAAEALLAAVAIPVYVNDRADVAAAAGAAGVHFGADDIPPRVVGRVVAAVRLRVGLSVGSAAEAAAARGAPADYWSLGPFFTTSNKPDAGRALGGAGFRRLAALAPPSTPVIAIGGISGENVAEVLEAGAAGVAVIGAVFGEPDVRAATAALRRRIDRLI